MDTIITMVMGAIVIAIIWVVFFYISAMRKDRKILDDYISGKHRRKNRSKKAVVRNASVSSQ